MCFPSAEFGMKDDLRKMEVGGVSSRDLYVKREFDVWLNSFHVAHESIQWSIRSIPNPSGHLKFAPPYFLVCTCGRCPDRSR